MRVNPLKLTECATITVTRGSQTAPIIHYWIPAMIGCADGVRSCLRLSCLFSSHRWVCAADGLLNRKYEYGEEEFGISKMSCVSRNPAYRIILY